jgi:hypothetical protein
MVIATIIEKIKSIMAKVVDNIKNWWKERKFVFSRYSKDAQETQEPERSLLSLPDAARKKLVSGVENIGSNPADKEAIISTLNEAFEQWQNSPTNTNNSVVVLSSPITAVSRILTETLQEWTEQKQVSIKFLPLKARPDQIETIESKLKHYFEEQSNSKASEEQPEVAVIPNLGWCFLRSLDGLKGIEYLQTQLFKDDKKRFWIIGGGQVGWQYLNSVCAIEAYCGEVFTLPEIESEKLEDWFVPIIEELEITFDDPSIDKQLLDGDKDNKTNYFEKLADISEGVSTVAVQGFLKSIHYEKVDDDDDDETSSEPKKLVAQVPKLPDLPELESADQYILYSLLLHGDLTISALAESLGDAEAEVQARVQLLRQEGVVEEKNKVLKINPIHYPKIQRKLASNNFIINKE